MPSVFQTCTEEKCYSLKWPQLIVGQQIYSQRTEKDAINPINKNNSRSPNLFSKQTNKQKKVTPKQMVSCYRKGSINV